MDGITGREGDAGMVIAPEVSERLSAGIQFGKATVIFVLKATRASLIPIRVYLSI
jgi:hypothetical protein